ncbi:MAG TPA: hypothetical protein VF033_04400 [Steroidobacteraceae bacterium]
MKLRYAWGAVTAGLFGALAAGPAAAADWELNPRLEAGYLYDDNYRLAAPGNEIDVSGPMLDAQMEWRALTQTSEFSLTPRVRATYFPDAEDLDSVDYLATLDWTHRGQRVTSSLVGDFSLLDIVRSEQPEVDTGGDLGEPDLGDSGHVVGDNRRKLISLRPIFLVDVSQRRQLQLSGGYTDVSFDEQFFGAQVDYKVADVAIGLANRLNERTNLVVRLRGTRYDLASRLDTNDGYGAELQWDRTTAADTRSYVRLGAQQVELLDGEKETNWVAGAGVNFLMGRNELFLDGTHSIGPSSAGALVTRDQLRLRWTRAFTPRLNLLAGIRATRDEDVEDTLFTVFTERKYATGDLGLEWRWQEEYSLRVAYDYTWQEYEDSTVAAKSSGAMVSVTYQPLQRRR